MKKEEITIQKVKNNPAGGVLIGKNKEGQTIIPNDGSLGGFLVGKLHKEGGIKAINMGNGQPIEMQSNEIVITAPAVSDTTKKEFQGKMMTNRQILSKINSDGGGVSFADGGEMPKSIKHTGASYKYGGKTMTDHEIMTSMNSGGHLADGFSLRDISDIHQVPLTELKKQVRLGMEAESEHTSSKREQMQIVKDHLFENPEYYTLLKKVGLSDGGIFKDGGYVSYKDKYNKKYDYDKNTPHTLEQISKDTGVSMKGLQQIYNKGIGAYKTNPQSVRPNVKSKEQWAMARVYSAVMGGKASNVDSNELKMNNGGSLVRDSKNGNSPSRDLNNYNDVLDLQADGMVGAETGLYVNGGETDLSFLDNVTKVFDDGGATELPKVEFLKISSTGSSLSSLTGKEFYNFREMKEAVESVYKTLNQNIKSSIYFSVNGIGNSMGTYISNGKNTVANFNPYTGKPSDLEKVFTKRNRFTFNKYNWKDWFGVQENTKTTRGKKTQTQTPTKTATSSNQSKAIEVTSMNIYYYNNDDKKISANIDNVLDLKKQFDTIQKNNNSNTKFVYLNPVEGANPIDDNSRIYLTNDPSDEEDFDTLKSNEVQLKSLLKRTIFKNQNYNWEKFFIGNETSQTQTPTTQEPVKSNRNFQLERKYLTSRINELSKELDMKRPTLLNEEIAFYQREINKFILKLRKVMNDENEEKPISERMEAVYSVKFGDYNKDYPQTDLVSYNGVKSELTDEEYLTVRTPEFKAFFGDWEQGSSAGVSKVINQKTKEPLAVWHGTNVLFTEWKTYATNNAHYFSTKRDFSEFFASEWESRTDKAGVDSKVLKDLNPNKGKFLFHCFIDVRNPIDFSRFGVDKRPISDYLTFLKINYNIGDYDFWTGLGNASGFTKDTKVYAWQIIRLWQNFTNYVKLYTTYDGYIFYEYNPNTPTGGLENASLCFCAFESNQVKFTNAYEFNALSNDSRFDFGGTI